MANQKFWQKLLKGLFTGFTLDKNGLHTSGDESFDSLFGKSSKNGVLGNVVNRYTGNGLTDADKESAELSLQNQMKLNEQERDINAELYERYNSPEAQVRQYQSAGLNPMLLSGGAAGASVQSGSGGSASAPSPSPLDLLGTILSYKVQKQRADNETELVESQKYRNFGSGDLSFANAGRVTYLMDIERDKLEQETKLLGEKVRTERVEQRLKAAGISVAEADAALKVREAAIKAIEGRYSDLYWQNQLTLQKAEADLKGSQSSLNRANRGLALQTIENLKVEQENLIKKGVGLVLENGNLAHEFEILGVKANAVRGDVLQNRITGYIGTVTDVIGAVSGFKTAGASVSRAATYDRDTEYRQGERIYRRYNN